MEEMKEVEPIEPIERLADIWTEVELCEKLNLPYNKTTLQSRSLGKWVKMGLPCFKIIGRRFFVEADVVNFLNENRLNSKEVE